jgi:guanylate kinase
MPPSIEILDARLRGRGTEDPDKVARRLKNAHDEIDRAPDYDHRVVNDDVDRALKKIEDILGLGPVAAGPKQN